MRGLAVSGLVCALLAGGEADLDAQGVADLLASIKDGGGWVQIPVVLGRGKLQTGTLPTIGLHIAGCAKVWGGHSGRWRIRAHDTQSGGRLEMSSWAGEDMPFAYTTGLTAQLDVDVRWSEPRDTTLLLWVGLEGPTRDSRAACEPTYSDSVRRGSGTERR